MGDSNKRDIFCIRNDDNDREECGGRPERQMSALGATNLFGDANFAVEHDEEHAGDAVAAMSSPPRGGRCLFVANKEAGARTPFQSSGGLARRKMFRAQQADSGHSQIRPCPSSDLSDEEDEEEREVMQLASPMAQSANAETAFLPEPLRTARKGNADGHFDDNDDDSIATAKAEDDSHCSRDSPVNVSISPSLPTSSSIMSNPNRRKKPSGYQQPGREGGPAFLLRGWGRNEEDHNTTDDDDSVSSPRVYGSPSRSGPSAGAAQRWTVNDIASPPRPACNPFSPSFRQSKMSKRRQQPAPVPQSPFPTAIDFIPNAKSFDSQDTTSANTVTTASTLGSCNHSHNNCSAARGSSVRFDQNMKGSNNGSCGSQSSRGAAPSNNPRIGRPGGFPDKNGRYSFTGSPIEEFDADSDTSGMGNKIRRLNLGPDDCVKLRVEEDAVEDEPSSPSRSSPPLPPDPNESATKDWQRKADLYIDTKFGDQNDTSEEISPTDVMSFPSPPTPRKKMLSTKKEGSSTVFLALGSPIRGNAPTCANVSIPPETPLLKRKNRPPRRRVFAIDDEEEPEDGVRGLKEMTGSRHKRRERMSKSRFDEDFQIVGEAGVGSFGTVYKCLSRLDGCLYAVKAAKRKAKGISDRDRMLKEVYALAALGDQADTAAFHIVRYHQAWMEENRLYIQTELCTSTLEAEMKEGTLCYDIQRLFKLTREILLALELIHRNGMVHLDIKPANIFIKNDQFKLGDFGLVSKLSNQSDVEEGDSRYMSMDLLSGEHEDLTKSDIFSLGATLYEACLGRTLPTDGEEWQDIRAGILSPLPNTPTELREIISLMMNPNPSARPTATTLLKRRQLLSEEQKQLIAEKTKVLEANMALAVHQERLKHLTPPKKKLVRSHTWTFGR